jgi:integrase
MMARVAWEKKLIDAVRVIKSQGRTEGRLRYFTKDVEAENVDLLTHWGEAAWAVFFMFLVDTGARPNEARLVRWVSIKGGKPVLEADTTKTARTRAVPLTARLIEALPKVRFETENAPKKKRVVYENKAGPYTWATKSRMRDIWSRLRAHIGWMDEETIPHTFRHTCASRLTMAEAPQVHIMLFMGHSNAAPRSATCTLHRPP